MRRMGDKISWHQIEALYDQEWVELTDFDWEETELFPTAGCVRVHSRDQKEFHRLIKRDTPLDSAILFVGKKVKGRNAFLTSNLRQIINERVQD